MIKRLRGGWGFGAERRRWRMKRGGESVAVEKIERTNSAKIFSGTARRAGLRFAEEASPPQAESEGDYGGAGKKKKLPSTRIGA